MSERRCETCRHWRAPSEPDEYGECVGIDENLVCAKTLAELKCLPDGYNALFTMRDFFCAMYEEKA